MMKKHIYRAILPDGKEVTRTSARTYTHLVYVTSKEGKSHVIGWSGSLVLAKKLASSALGMRKEKIVEKNGKYQYVKTNEHIYVAAKIIPIVVK